jgi:hypothetical protein
MDAEIKRKWVEALRSGKYEQTQGRLHLAGAHCCLGVLCSVRGMKIGFNDQVIHGGVPAGYEPLHELVGDKACVKLADMNDHGKSFAEIADYIEKHL